MSSCKDCVHYEVCKDEVEFHHGASSDLEVDGVEKHCEFFKPKSRFVELPCEVGQTVFEIQPIRKRIQAYEVITAKYNGLFWWFTWVLKDGEGIYGNTEGFHSKELGKTVFLSREEAEKALAERSK